MPTDLPKITVYLSEESFEVVAAAAQALGQSRSKLLAELVESALPVFEVLTDAATTLAVAPDRQRAAFAHLAEGMESKRVSADALMSEVVDLFGQAGKDPLPSNRGVRKPK